MNQPDNQDQADNEDGMQHNTSFLPLSFGTGDNESDLPITRRNTDPLSQSILGRSMSSNTESGTFHTLSNICKCFAGAASFELPWAFKQAGAVLAGISLILLAIMTNYTLKWLAMCGHYHPRIVKPTYPEIAQHAFGKIGFIIAWFGILAMTIGVCGSYLVFIGSEMSKLLKGAFPNDNFVINTFTSSVCTLLTAIPIIFLSWMRSYRFLVPTSQLGLVALIFALIVTMYDAGSEFNTNTIKNEIRIYDIKHFPLFLGNAAFLYLISSVILPVEQGMRKRPRYRVTHGYIVALNWAMVIVTVLNIIFAEFSYLSFGNNVCGNVIDNLDHGWLKSIVAILLCIDLFFTYALFLFPISESLEKTIFDENKFGQRKIEIERNIIRGILVFSTCGIALLVPNFQQLTGLTGAFGNNVLGLILPPLMYFKLTSQNGPWKRTHSIGTKIFGYSISIFGIIMLFVCVAFFVEAIINTSNSSSC